MPPLSAARALPRVAQPLTRRLRALSTSAPPLAPTVSFIGVGNMGGPMATNLAGALAEQAHEIRVFDVNGAAASELAAGLGNASSVESVGEAASGADVVITMVPESKHVEAVYLGEGGIIDQAAAGTLLIDSSTISPQCSQQVAATAASAGMAMVDAPVSGGVKKAVLGTLTFMVGGEDEAFARARPYFEVMGENIVHCGASGSGQVAKICNNMAMAINMAGCAEAMNLAIQQGLDPDVFAGIINTSSGGSWISTVYGCVPGTVEGSPSNNNYQGGFSNQLLLKDVRLARDAATAVGQPTPMASMAECLWDQLLAAGHAGLDQGSIYEKVYRAKEVAPPPDTQL